MRGFGTYGVTSAVDAGDEAARLREEITRRGFAVMPSVIDAAEVARLNETMDAVYARQCKEVGGEAQLHAIADTDIVRCLLAYDDAFASVATHPALLALVRSLIGDNVVLLMQNGIINRPDRLQAQTKWHRDLNYQHWVITRPIAISALLTLEDFNETTGGTTFMPGSHSFPDFPSPDFAARFEEAPVVPGGSLIVFDSMVFHRAGVNRSNGIRRAINHVYGSPILAQQVDIPSMLDRDPPEDQALLGLLGYRWSPVRDVAAWRRRKIAVHTPPAEGRNEQTDPLP